MQSEMVSEATRERFDRAVMTRLRALGRRLRLYILVDGLTAVSLAVLVAILLTLAVDRTLRLGRDMRAAQLASVGLALAALIWRMVVSPLRMPLGSVLLALLVERRFPLLRSRLITAVEFVDPASAGLNAAVRRSPALINSVVHQAEVDAAPLRFTDVLAHRRAGRGAAVLMVCAAAVVVLTLAARPTMALWFRRNVLLERVDWPVRNRLTVEGLTDGRVIVPRGEDVTVAAVVDEGCEPPRQAYIEYRDPRDQSDRRQMPAVPGEAVRFTHTFARIAETLRCRISGGDARTDWFTLEVVERPQISGVTIGIDPPAYTHLEPYELRPGQTVAEALHGSGIRFHAQTNKPVRQATLVRTVGDAATEVGPVSHTIDRDLTAADRPEASASYHFRLVDEQGLTSESDRASPVRISIRLVADRAPKVKMKIKGPGEMITRDAILPIEMECADTYGLASAALVWRTMREGALPVREPIPGFEAATKTFTCSLNWPVASRGLREGDRLELHAEATDFDDVSGPNVGASPTIVFRIVSREELLAELNRREQEYRQDFERLIRQQEELYSDLLTAGPGGGPRADSQADPRRLAELARRQRDYGARLNSLRLQFEQVLSELRVNQLSGPTSEARLGDGVVGPMTELGRSRTPAAADRIDALGREPTPENDRAAREAQEALLAEMNRILSQMLKWEGFQEAVVLLREILRMQGQLNEETEKRIEAAILGTEPAP